MSEKNSTYESVKSFYKKFDNYQDLYNQGFWKEYRKIAADMILADFGNCSSLRVLDLGGGAMASLPTLLADDLVHNYTIVDLVVRISSDLQKVNLIENDILSFLESYDGPRFDAVVIFGVLEYLSTEDAIKVLSKLPAVMSPRGRVLVHEPNARAERHLSKGQGKQHAIELGALLTGTGLRLGARCDYHLIWLRRLLNLSPFRFPALLKAGLTCERYFGGGVDSLYLLELDS
jgi:cyclopropane fatty-acyl-phospholipid synthase-like methyltransferase